MTLCYFIGSVTVDMVSQPAKEELDSHQTLFLVEMVGSKHETMFDKQTENLSMTCCGYVQLASSMITTCTV